VDRALYLLDQALAEPGVRVTRRAMLMERRAMVLRDLGREDESGATLRAALDLLPAEPLTYTHAVVLTSLAVIVMLSGDRDQRDIVTRAVEVATQVQAEPQLAEALITLGTMQASTDGDIDTGLATLLDGLRLAERLGAVETTIRGHVNYSHLLEMAGRHQEAIDFAGAGVELARRTGRARTTGAFLTGNMVEPMVRLGRWQEAEAAAVQAIRSDPEGVFAVPLLEPLAHIAVLSGRREDAQRHCERLGQLLRVSHDPQMVQPLAFARAEMRRLAGDHTGALKIIMAALAEERDVGMGRHAWPLVWLGSRIAADLTILSRDRRVADEAGAEAADKLAEIAAALPAIAPSTRGYRASTAAERGRPAGDEKAWEDAVAAWRATDEPYQLAYSLFRLAEDRLAGGDRRTATELAREASELAARMDARPLLDDIEALARRGRLSLGNEEREERPPEPVDEDPLAHFGLTEREREVLSLIAGGRSNAQIATELFISPKTASVHVSNILAKLGVTGRVEAAALVHRLT
jgi:DNA-binding CsgD family transcriptional regulator/tetratricopeptide (TPR) repeat protein